MKSRPFLLGPLGSLALLVVGCASPLTAVRDDNQRLSSTVADLRADKRAQDRKLMDLQHQLDLARAKQLDIAPYAPPPNLPVEVATPSPSTTTPGQRIVGVTEDGTEIVYEGDAANGKTATFGEDDPPAPAPAHRAPRVASSPPVPTVAADDRLEVTHKVAARPAPNRARRDHDAPGERTASAGDPAADYRAAVELVKTGPFDDAVAALHAFIAKYPHHDYADNAQYWLGEAYYAQKDFAHALVEFRAVIEIYPRGNKVPDALLKVGYCYGALGQADKAKAVLEQVIALYPKSEPAALAAKKLEPK